MMAGGIKFQVQWVNRVLRLNVIMLRKIMAGSRYRHASAVDLIAMQRRQGDAHHCLRLCCQVVSSWSCVCRSWQNL